MIDKNTLEYEFIYLCISKILVSASGAKLKLK